jgi:hypothetical protein
MGESLLSTRPDCQVAGRHKGAPQERQARHSPLGTPLASSLGIPLESPLGFPRRPSAYPGAGEQPGE